ncbi:MAG: hypothetical protein WA666_05010, partial [Nitrospirota bacterium]
MKRFLILSILTAFLAIPAISLADGPHYGHGTVPSITVQAKSTTQFRYANGAYSNNTSVMKVETYTLRSGSMNFAVNDNNTNNVTSASVTTNNNNNKGAQSFTGQIYFAGPATIASGAKLSNMFINMSGIIINATRTQAAPIGQGFVRGFVTHTDSVANGGQTGTVNFTGAYTMSVALAGFTRANGNNPTHGSASITMVLSGIFDPSGSQGVVVTVAMPATAFTLSTTPTQPAETNSTWALSADMTSGPDSPQSITANLSLNLYDGYLITGTLTDPSNNVNNVSGTLVNNNINASFTDGSGNTTTLTGSVTTGTYGT